MWPPTFSPESASIKWEATRMQTLEPIWDANRDYVRRLLARLTGSADLADDLVQETYLRARAGIAGYRGGDSRAWLATIARNVFLAHTRRESARREVPVKGDVGSELSSLPDAQHLLSKIELHDEVVRLAGPLRTALVMKYYGGLTYAEIARYQHCPLGTAKWRVSAAVSKLQDAFGVGRKEVTAMASRSLKEDVLSQLDLQPLRFSLQDGSCEQTLRKALRVTVTEVFGSSPRITDGSNYLVCGRYWMRHPVVDSMVLAATGKTTGYHAFVSPGEGAFELYAHVVEATPGRHDLLTIRVFPDGGDCSIAAIRLRPPGKSNVAYPGGHPAGVGQSPRRSSRAGRPTPSPPADYRKGRATS